MARLHILSSFALYSFALPQLKTGRSFAGPPVRGIQANQDYPSSGARLRTLCGRFHSVADGHRQ